MTFGHYDLDSRCYNDEVNILRMRRLKPSRTKFGAVVENDRVAGVHDTNHACPLVLAGVSPGVSGSALNEHVTGLLDALLTRFERHFDLARDLDDNVEADGAVGRTALARRGVDVPHQATAAREGDGRHVGILQVLNVVGEIGAIERVGGLVGDVAQTEQGTSEVLLDRKTFVHRRIEVRDASLEISVGNDTLGVGKGLWSRHGCVQLTASCEEGQCN